jgi:hypothetical protein
MNQNFNKYLFYFSIRFYLNQFSPSGWDNETKINILLENSPTIKSDSEYSDVIAKPSNIRKPLQRDVEIVTAIEDQEFLAKLQIIFNKSATPNMKQVCY